MRCPTPSELPPPPDGKTDWPWTEQIEPLPERMPDGSEWPLISIVTPNYNYGRFLEETIRSVLLQGYPKLEYIIIDGGSTDNSVEIIKKYEQWLTYWVSKPDKGQVDSINKGLQRSTGEWFNWLNSDDILLKGSLKTLGTLSNILPEAGWITGTSLLISEAGSVVDFSAPWRTDSSIVGLGYSSFPQDSTFVRIEFMRQSGITLNPEISNIFDTLLHWQLLKCGNPLLTPACLSAMRLHSQQKTANLENRVREGKIWLEPHQKTLRLWQRVGIRLLGTRFHRLFRSLLGLGVYYGFTPTSQNWKAVVYDQQQYQWKLVAARDAVLF